MIRAKKRNDENPWRFVLPQENPVTSTEESSPASEENISSEADFQQKLRENDNLKWLNTLDDQPLTMQD